MNKPITCNEVQYITKQPPPKKGQDQMVSQENSTENKELIPSLIKVFQKIS